MTLAEKILSLRTERGMSQDDLAERMEVSRQSVSKWETGQSTPDLDRVIRLADLFGVTVDELVREGERPPAPEPPQPQVIYVERRREGLTRTWWAGMVLAALGVVLVPVGILGPGVWVILPAGALILLSMPLLLAKRYPWLIAGWLLVAMSLAAFNPYFSGGPWGLAGGLRILYLLTVYPDMRRFPYYVAVALGVVRGTMVLVLLYFTWQAWKQARKAKKEP